MTTRRSRLKAVANLPVRRKVPTLQENADNVDTLGSSLPSNAPHEAVIPSGQGNEQQKTYPLTASINGSSGNNSDSNHLTLNIGKLERTRKNDNTNETFIKVNVINDLKSKYEGQINGRVDNTNLWNCDNLVKAALVSSVTEENCVVDIATNEDNYKIQTSSTIPNNEKGIQSTLFNVENSSLQTFESQFTLGDNENCVGSVINANINEVIRGTDEFEPVLTTLISCNVGISCTNFNNFTHSSEPNELESQNESVINNISKDTVLLKTNNYPGKDYTSPIIASPNKDKTGENFLYRKESVNSNISTNVTSKRNVASVKKKRSRCSDFNKKVSDARKEFQRKYEHTKPDRSALKMIDLIFYNPTTNPMESKNKSDKKEDPLQGDLITESLAEEEVDEPLSMNSNYGLKSPDAEGVNLRMPVPQVKIGLNGEIILDEKSIIIETTDAKKGREDLLKNSLPIFEERVSRVSYYRGKTRKTRDWSDFETKRFYKALNTIGPDFSLMQKYFPKRSRMELKNKFKREERLNRNLVDKALINPSEFDMTQLEKDLAVEKKAEERERKMRLVKGLKEKQTGKRQRTKSSLFSREIMECNCKNDTEPVVAKSIGSKLIQNEIQKKNKEMGSVKRHLLRDLKQDLNDNSQVSASCII